MVQYLKSGQEKLIILEEYINTKRILFEKGKIQKKIQEIWLKLFDETLPYPKSINKKIAQLKKKGFIFNFKKDKYSLIKDYIIDNNILFPPDNVSKHLRKVWLELFKESISSNQANYKLQYLKKKGFHFNFHKDKYTILKEYIINNNILFQRNNVFKHIQNIWLELFKESISSNQAFNKYTHLKGKGFRFNFHKDRYLVLKEYIINNNIMFTPNQYSEIFKKIWLTLFKEELSTKKAQRRFFYLKSQGFKFNFSENLYEVLEEYLNKNNFILFKGKKGHTQIKEIWFKLFNEEISLSKVKNKIRTLKRRGFNFNFNKTNTQKTLNYIIDNQIIFKTGKRIQEIKEIWFKLFNEEISSKKAQSVIDTIKTSGYILRYEKDYVLTFSEYLLKHNIKFNKYELHDELTKIWFNLFDEELTLNKRKRVITELNKISNFIKDDCYQLLMKYIINNETLFPKNSKATKIQEIWYKIFNKEISLRKAYSAIQFLIRNGIEFKYEKDSYSKIIDYINENKIEFQERNISSQFCVIWFKLFKERLSIKKSQYRVLKLKKRGFIFKYKSDNNQVFLEYLINNKIILNKKKFSYQIKEIWFNLFNQNLSSQQIHTKIYYLKKNGAKIIFNTDLPRIISEYLVRNDIWIEESNNGYKYLQKLWKELFNEEINFSKAKLILIKVAYYSPESVSMELLENFVSFDAIDKLSENEYQEQINIFGSFCRKSKITITEDISLEKITRIWSVCFAKNK